MKIAVRFSHQKNPVTEPNFEKVEQYESGYDFEEMIERAVDGVETLTITKDYQSDKDRETDALAEDLF
ncbi:thiamine biosynthesis protein ThiI [Staphylococcus auricularis]|nr:thiamine biosynthesis protein ThiI [Staphylococcus auricularis]